MHILFLSDNFPPEVNAPASRTFEHCREWVAAGHQVTVITCLPNFPKGQIFDGYRNKLWQSEDMAGIRVIRVWSFIVRNEGFALRTLDYVSYMVTAGVAALFVRKVDVVVGTSPQFFTACAAYVVGSLKRRPWVFELRDLWPESIRAVGAIEHSLVIAFLEKVELFLYRNASAVVSVTHSLRENLVRRGIDGGKIHVVTNGVELGRFFPQEKDATLESRLGLGSKFVAGYIGTHGMAHGLETLVAAAKLLASAPDGDRFRILMLGDGANRRALEKSARAQGLHNIIFIGTVSKEEVPRYWSLLDASVIHLKKSDLFKTVIPSKLFECMAMGIPVLHGVEGESAAIVAEAGVGWTFEPENVDELVAAIRRLECDPEIAKRFRANGPRAAATFDRKILAKNMLKLLVMIRSRRDIPPL